MRMLSSVYTGEMLPTARRTRTTFQKALLTSTQRAGRALSRQRPNGVYISVRPPYLNERTAFRSLNAAFSNQD